MWHDEIQTIVPLWRNDAGNNGLHDSVQAAFQSLGGAVTPGFRYEPTTTDFYATTAVASQIASLTGGCSDPSTIAVYLAAFDEVVDVFHSAQTNDALRVRRGTAATALRFLLYCRRVRPPWILLEIGSTVTSISGRSGWRMEATTGSGWECTATAR